MASDEASVRISDALTSLTRDLKKIRNQDINLMKQFITINNTLQKINKSFSNEFQRISSSSSLSTLSRKSSADSLLSVSSTESLCSGVSFSDLSSASKPMLPMAFTISGDEDSVSESAYNAMLMTNIKIWKQSENDGTVSDLAESDEDV